MTYQITVHRSLDDLKAAQTSLYTGAYDRALVDHFWDSSVKRVSLPEYIVIPVRTDNFSNFCKDLFFPGFIHGALKIKDLGQKIFFCILTPLWDLMTLPIRLITAIPRYIYNRIHSKEVHPFYQFLISKNVQPQDLAAGHVYVEFTAGEGQSIKGGTLNFMQLPNTVSEVQGRQGEREYRLSGPFGDESITGFDPPPLKIRQQSIGGGQVQTTVQSQNVQAHAITAFNAFGYLTGS